MPLMALGPRPRARNTLTEATRPQRLHTPTQEAGAHQGCIARGKPHHATVHFRRAAPRRVRPALTSMPRPASLRATVSLKSCSFLRAAFAA